MWPNDYTAVVCTKAAVRENGKIWMHSVPSVVIYSKTELRGRLHTAKGRKGNLEKDPP
jgi:hypothetical protein